MAQRKLLEDERILLRVPEPEDLELMYRMENDTTLWDVGCTTIPYSRFALRRYITESTGDIYVDRQLRMMIVDKIQTCVMGCIDLVNFDVRNRRAEVGILVLSEYRHSGVATCALRLLVDYALGFLHLCQLIAYVPVDNVFSHRLFSHAGFSTVALLKSWLCRGDGIYADVTFMQCLNKVLNCK